MATPLILKKVSRRLREIVGWPSRFIQNTYVRTLEFICSALTDRYWLLDYLPSHRNNVETVLVVRLDLIGDFVLWLDAAKELKRIYPSSRIVLYGNSVWSEIAQQLPFWDKVVPVDVPRLRTDLLYRIRVLFQIRRQSFDIALQPTFSREYIGDLTIRSSNAAQRIAHFGDQNNINEDNKRLTDTWYTKLVDVDNRIDSMELQSNAHFVNSLGGPTYCSGVPKLPMLCDLPSHLRINRRYIVIVPGASWQPRAWPIECFAELMMQLNSNNPTHFVLCGATHEKALCDQLLALCPILSTQNLAGHTSLAQMIEVIRGAELTIANESAAIHIAAATGTPSVCITGGGHYGRFMPYQVLTSDTQSIPFTVTHRMDCFGCRWNCPLRISPESAVPCITKISVDDVFAKCKLLLDARVSQD
jgi:ADP-heptose:LPS heptosyltransferase